MDLNKRSSFSSALNLEIKAGKVKKVLNKGVASLSQGVVR